jgi:hypothetical protein
VLAASVGVLLPANLMALGVAHRRATLRIGVIRGPATSELALAGIALGHEEAAKSASLFGATLDLEMRSVGSPADAVAAATSLGSAWHASALVLALGDTDTCAAVGEAAGDVGVSVLNALCTSDALRGERCNGALFHVIPSDAMRQDALAVAKVGVSHGGAGAQAQATSRRAVAWHASLEKFGAEQLNQRFRARARAEMDDAAWAGWLALKILLESALRAPEVDGPKLRVYLERPDARFDGHKGVPLSFRPWDHQLRQPLYVVAGDTIAEAPAGNGEDSNARDRLDRLGSDSAHSTCPRARRDRE